MGTHRRDRGAALDRAQDAEAYAFGDRVAAGVSVELTVYRRHRLSGQQHQKKKQQTQQRRQLHRGLAPCTASVGPPDRVGTARCGLFHRRPHKSTAPAHRSASGAGSSFRATSSEIHQLLTAGLACRLCCGLDRTRSLLRLTLLVFIVDFFVDFFDARRPRWQGVGRITPAPRGHTGGRRGCTAPCQRA